jgi:hypothetical protein
MDFAVRPTLSKDAAKIVLVALEPLPYPGVFVMVACEDIRQEFGVLDASNELLCQRARLRRTNKDALEEKANSLFDAGHYTLDQGMSSLKSVART